MLQNMKETEQRAIDNTAKSKDSVILNKIDTNSSSISKLSDKSIDGEALHQLKQQVLNLQQRLTDVTKQRDAIKSTSSSQNSQMQRLQQIHIDEKTALVSKVEDLEKSLQSTQKVWIHGCPNPHNIAAFSSSIKTIMRDDLVANYYYLKSATLHFRTIHRIMMN